MKVTVIEWIDSCSYSDQGWHPAEDHDVSPVKIVSVGQILSEDEESVTLIMNWSEGNNVCSDMTIPKVSIIEWTDYEISTDAEG